MSDLPQSSPPPGGPLPGGSQTPVPYISPDMQASTDAEHLRILSICYYVLAGIQSLLACGFGGVYLVIAAIGFFGGAASGDKGGAAGGVMAGGLFGCVGMAIILVVGGMAFLIFKVGQSLVKRRNRTLCFVIACIICMSFPLGTALGVFTLIVLSRPSVKASFT